MKLFYFVILLLVVLSNISKQALCLDPITGIALGVGISSAMYAYFSPKDDPIKKTAKKVIKKIGQKIGYYEGCEDYWIPQNMNGLRADLHASFFGQPFVTEMVLNKLESHLNNEPMRPLILSFHGDPGLGKSFVSKKILKHMFKEGQKTEYVHYFRGSIDFPLQQEVYKYKDQISKIIGDKIFECHRSVFVFEEVDKMPSGVIDVLLGFINIGKIGDLDFRRSIFILLSNVGGRVLFQETLQNYVQGQDRINMNKKRLGNLLAEEAFNAKGGLMNSALIRRLSSSNFIPFLPLEEVHILKCLEMEVKKINQILSKELIDQVLQELRFIPDDNPIFADGGCKLVAEKVHFFIERQKRRNSRRKNV